MADVFRTLQQRNAEHKKNHVLKGTIIFRNQGKRSAGIYEHAHSQIISFPFIPKAISDELNGARKYYQMKTRCIFCDMISEEKGLAKRVVYETEYYFAWCPFASRFPFETCIIPKKHDAEFLNADSATFNDLARTIHTVLAKYDKVLGDVPISFVLHTAPLRSETDQEQAAAGRAYHWHVELMPHAWQVGAFEWGGDLFLAPPTPENCAKILANTNV
jgi:UDPglucose--hexose-1-phosphate uridylyltransferase